ncbi:MAG: ABC transporter ATP-binding protein [Desulfoplanes sp.]|nr:ABC transporter ATP-binding protein [Desulfoplanes sp.]
MDQHIQQQPLLAVQNVSKNFGGVQAVLDVNFSIPAGRITGLIGPNGAGKTTLFNLISGTILPSSGKIHFAGRDITRTPPQTRSRLGMMRTFQNLSLYPELTCLENVTIGANAWYRPGPLSLVRRGGGRTEQNILADALGYLEQIGLLAKKDIGPDKLSYGDQRRLEIARAMMGHPKLLLLDEPAAGLNNQESQELAELLLHIRDTTELTILIIEHDMDVLMTVSDLVLVLVEGQLLLEDTPRKVQQDPQVIEAYLGKEE